MGGPNAKQVFNQGAENILIGVNNKNGNPPRANTAGGDRSTEDVQGNVESSLTRRQPLLDVAGADPSGLRFP